MRSFILVTMFTVALAGAATSDFELERRLSLDAGAIDTLTIECGAGSLEVLGVPGATGISVSATIEIGGEEADAALDIIESDLELSLERQGNKAQLKAYFERSLRRSHKGARVHLLVRMPDSLRLSIADGSGPVKVRDVLAAIDIDDGSGSLDLANVGGAVQVVDGSGSISAVSVGGDLSIDDGSGGIFVERVSGSVTIDDGSGSIEVNEVSEDLVIVDDGSGRLNFSAIGGRVVTEG